MSGGGRRPGAGGRKEQTAAHGDSEDLCLFIWLPFSFVSACVGSSCCIQLSVSAYIAVYMFFLLFLWVKADHLRFLKLIKIVLLYNCISLSGTCNGQILKCGVAVKSWRVGWIIVAFGVWMLL
jgi:hypothetical protein